MGHHSLRKDMTCLNCNHVVEKRFCPNCGQENTDSRKSFHHLFVHFFEDLTHYENAFWKTIRNLLLKPASLTKEYLSGKRLSYLAPVRLYIFISFITFLVISIFSKKEETTINVHKAPEEKQSISAQKNEKVEVEKFTNEDFFNFGYKSVKELDSLQEFGPPKDKLSDFEYWVNKKVLLVKEKNTKEEILEKFKESFVHNLPKVLIIYMPLFAFILWLFHDKKKWYYFDHGIFTLHYFSFLLLILLLESLFNNLVRFFEDYYIVEAFSFIVNLIASVWMLYYFYPAHHRFYGGTRTNSFVKSTLLFFINSIIITFVILAFTIYTFLNIH